MTAAGHLPAPAAGEPSRRIGLERACALALALWCLFAAFWRLDAVNLYRDEADTAILAQDMVQHHRWIPRYFDGRQLVTHLPDGSDIDGRFIPVIPGWMQFYVEAASFRFLGVNTWTARLPFALLGLAALFVIYRTGRLLSPGLGAWLPLLLASTSVFTWYALRQARYYALVYLFAALLLYEFCRYLKDRSLARHAGFYVRVGLWCLLLDYSHWGSFAATWFALTVFVGWTRDRALWRGWAATTAALAIPVTVEFALIHLPFLGHSRASLPMSGYVLRFMIKANGEAIWMIFPLLFLVPAAVWLWAKPPVRAPNPFLLAGSMIVLSIGFTTAAARAAVEPRYYLQILPALAVFEAATVLWVARLASAKWAFAVGAACLLWPALSWNADWSDELMARQITGDRSYGEPLYAYLNRHVRAGETLQVFPNEEGQPVHFYVPQVRWVGQLDSSNPRNQRYRGTLPPSAFDDYAGVDWLIIWYNPLQPAQPQPPAAMSGYRKVWEHRYPHPPSLWDRVLWTRFERWYHGGATDRLDGFEVWHKEDKDNDRPLHESAGKLSEDLWKNSSTYRY